MSKISSLVELFKRFPGIGEKQATRFTHYISQADKTYIDELVNKIQQVYEETKRCPICFICHEESNDTCRHCDHKSDKIIIVEKDIDAHALQECIKEPVNYFVLGTLIPITHESTIPKRLENLFERIKKNPPTEIVIAFSIHPDAEHTMNFIANNIKKISPDTNISTLGRGMSGGAELEYMDQNTIDAAFERRIDV